MRLQGAGVLFALSLGGCAGGVKGAFIATWNYACVPDRTVAWRAPAAAAGAVVWAHGKSGGEDLRWAALPPVLGAFTAAGFDVVRFNRDPFADDAARATGWLHDCLVAVGRAGFQRVVAAGQSRGAWNVLAQLDRPGAASALIALSPAAHGTGGSLNFGAQLDDLRRIVDEAPRQTTRVAIAQFTDDPFDADAGRRGRTLHRLAAKIGTLLLIDRPPALPGHNAGLTPAFAARYSTALVRLATSAGEGG